MNKKKKIAGEEEMRKRIRQDLENGDSIPSKASSSKDEKAVEKDVTLQMEYIRKFIRNQIEEEIYASHPEFIKCENYLGEIRWLTPLEMENDYEFFPVTESRFSKIISFFRKPVKPDWVNDPIYDDLKAELRKEVEKDTTDRIEKFNQAKAANEERAKHFLESKIFREEQDKFYSSKPGYKKYRNHVGEEKWMTLDEFEHQDEFYEEVIPLKKKIIKWSLIGAIFILLVTGSIYLFDLINHKEMPKGYIVVKLNESRGNLYVDHKLSVGFRPDRAFPISAGTHHISVILPGFISEPRFREVTVGAGDTTTISFRFVHKEVKEGTLVIINAPFDDAGVFINTDFNGYLRDSDSLFLSAGEYTIIVEKEGYLSKPQQHSLKLSENDTIRLNFEMYPKTHVTTKTTINPLTDIGLIEVRSNIPRAEIFLDGHETGFQTDYVLQKIPYGRHIISVSKAGYRIYPEERVVNLNKYQKVARADFTLSSTTRQIKIRTRPVEGTIYINGRRVGFGNFQGSLPLGSHEITFGDVEYYDNPGSRTIEITETGPETYFFDYKSNFRLEFSPDGIKPAHTTAYINTGYIIEDRNFKNSTDTGPDIRIIDPISRNVWWMGYAFEYRNPRGTDAIMLTFSIPDNVDLSDRIYLKMYAYGTDSDYPLVLDGKSSYMITINNTPFRNNAVPAFSLPQAGENRFDEYMINNLLKKGYNRILISAANEASAYFALWKIVIE
ncbi:MAG: PEGA domain-containing protein [Calditrichaceae bacterium]|nr:PEGA domain-containing protein [Calditrichaceae bacterium]MBN2708645.1 PEGA domain-containing protein [Calditrichaceae bacterium]RQV92019.1 MAG: PEGA domain-containing protein [Calditrichota bacterium]